LILDVGNSKAVVYWFRSVNCSLRRRDAAAAVAVAKYSCFKWIPCELALLAG
jgi:hypothetical protein